MLMCNHLADSILHEAVCEGDIAMMHYLIDIGADVSEADESGYMPLDYAIDGEVNIEIVEALLRAGASVTKRSIFGGAPLHRAVCLGQIATIRSLLQYSAEANAEDIDGKTPLYLLHLHGRHSREIADKTPEIVQILRDSVDRKGRSLIAKKAISRQSTTSDPTRQV